MTDTTCILLSATRTSVLRKKTQATALRDLDLAKKRLTQAVAAARCAISQPRINDLLNGKVSRFSIDALVNIAASLGRPVQVKLARAL